MKKEGLRALFFICKLSDLVQDGCYWWRLGLVMVGVNEICGDWYVQRGECYGRLRPGISGIIKDDGAAINRARGILCRVGDG